MNRPMAKRRQVDAARLERADWERAALTAIASGGIDAVAVEPLARALGVTKGSFYWHFANREELLTAALARWEAEYTEGVIALLSAVSDPRRRLARLITEANLSEGAARFHAWLAAAVDHPVVQPVMSRVTARRIGYLVDCFAALGVPPAQARRRALLAYAAYVGLMHLSREAPAELPQGRSRAAYVRHLIAGLLPPS
jgi:AcrR family transcriptional regulator